jgi:hypothetical protein
MKSSVYSSGIICSILMLIGSVSKVMHWPGASIFLILAVSLFCLVFLPIALKDSYANLQRYKSLHIITFAVFFVCMFGVLFKVMHWPGASFFMLIGILSPFVIFLPAYLYYTKDQTREGNINFSGVMFGLIFLAVFTALLSLSPSRQIYERATMGSFTKELAASFTKISGDDDITKKANEVNEFIHKLKCEMLAAANEAPCPANAPLNSYEIKYRDNKQAPREVLLVNEAKMAELKKKISDFNSAIAAGNCSEELKSLSKEILSVNDVTIPEEKGGPYTMAWEQKTFINHELVFVLDALAQLQTNINIVAREYLAVKKS